MGGAHQTVNRHSRIIEPHPLPLPLGEVAERSEDGEGKPGCNTLSVTFGDSSPKGRAKGVYPHLGAKTERIGNRYAPFTILRSPIKGLQGRFRYPNRNYSRVAKCLMVRTI